LLGTKEQWKDYQPKLQMQLHIEERSQSQQIMENPNPEVVRKTKSEPPETANKPGTGIGKKLSVHFSESTTRAEVLHDDTVSFR